MNGQRREDVRKGQRVEIVLKQDQQSGRLTVGIVRDILTKSQTHAHGMKVRLTDGRIGRIQNILEP